MGKLLRCVSIAALACTAFACGSTDAGITTAVKAKLAADDSVKAYQVNVDTNNHVVTLTGTVNTLVARDEAVRLARQTDGVTDVVDNIQLSEAVPTSGIDAAGDDISSAAERTKDATADAATRARNDTKEAAGKAKEETKEAGESIGDAAKDGGRAVAGGAKKVGGEVADTAKKVGSAVAGGAKKVGSEVKDAVTDDKKDNKK